MIVIPIIAGQGNRNRLSSDVHASGLNISSTNIADMQSHKGRMSCVADEGLLTGDCGVVDRRISCRALGQ